MLISKTNHLLPSDIFIWQLTDIFALQLQLLFSDLREDQEHTDPPLGREEEEGRLARYYQGLSEKGIALWVK